MQIDCATRAKRTDPDITEYSWQRQKIWHDVCGSDSIAMQAMQARALRRGPLGSRNVLREMEARAMHAK